MVEQNNRELRKRAEQAIRCEQILDEVQMKLQSKCMDDIMPDLVTLRCMAATNDSTRTIASLQDQILTLRSQLESAQRNGEQ